MNRVIVIYPMIRDDRLDATSVGHILVIVIQRMDIKICPYSSKVEPAAHNGWGEGSSPSAGTNIGECSSLGAVSAWKADDTDNGMEGGIPSLRHVRNRYVRV